MYRLILFLLLTVLTNVQPKPIPNAKDLYRERINNHPFSQRPHFSEEEEEEQGGEAKTDRPDLAWEQDFLATMDPALGRPAPERLIPVYQQIAQMPQALVTAPGSSSSPWVERGPNNIGGRTRAIMFDPNDATHKKVWAGSVTGGLWYNSDITDPNSQWVSVNDFWDNISISSIAYDPSNTNVFYVGTGENWRGSTSGTRGAGIWKSTDGGISWNQVSGSTNFPYINDLVVRNENGSGVIYIGTRAYYYAGQWQGSSNQGLYRSTDGGNTFSQVSPTFSGGNHFAIADLEIGPGNRLWAGTISNASAGFSDQGGGRILTSTDGINWSASYTSSNKDGRVEVACAPSDSNYVYAMIESNSQVDEILKTNDGGTTWNTLNKPNDADNGIPSSDFSRGQAWYDLIMAVDPNDTGTVICGAVDLFRTTDGGNSWSQISKWANNGGLFSLPCSLVHADQHAIVYAPGNSSRVIFGNDGGIFYTDSIDYADNMDVIANRNHNYNVTQFYACAIHPNAGVDYFLAGAQDNGTQQFTNAGLNSTSPATGGDGAYCFIDQTDPDYQITSYVYNSYYISDNAGLWFSFLHGDQNTGSFINPADYDDNLHILYSARTSTTINRISDITGSPNSDHFTVTGMHSMVSHLRVSPYTTNSTTLFAGTVAGDLFKIEYADSTAPVATNIGNGLPSGNISCVEIGAYEDELLVTLSNYGITSVWYTDDGGTTWTSKEGDLPDMPVRWALFNPNNRDEVILATEVGVWSTNNFNSSTPHWIASSSGLANVRVDMLQIRSSDNEVIAATHGRGLFSSDGFFSTAPPTANFGYNSNFACSGDTLRFTDSSAYNPTAWQWTFTPNNVTYVNGTSASSRNPQVVINASGTYQVVLKASNANGFDYDTAQVNANIFAFPNLNFDSTTNTLTCKTNGPGITYQWFKDGLPINGANGQSIITTGDGDYYVQVSDGTCTVNSHPFNPATFGVDELALANNIQVYPNPLNHYVNLKLNNPDHQEISVKVISVNGQVVFEKDLGKPSQLDNRIELSGLTSGVYLLNIKAGSSSYYRKLIKN